MEYTTWVYPQSVDDLVTCLEDGARPVGGATGILRNPPRSGVFADLSGAGLKHSSTGDGTITLGAMVSYADTVATVAAVNQQHIVAKALNTVAAPALRNIITLGGSLALFPPWSRLVGPLVALDATVKTVGSNAGTYSVSQYAVSVDLKDGSAVIDVSFDVGRDWETHWFAFAPVRFNYPLFTVAVLVEPNGEAVADSRVVVTGNRGRVARLEGVESSVSGKDRAGIRVTPDALGTDFVDRQGFSAEYLTGLVATYITRSLAGERRVS